MQWFSIGILETVRHSKLVKRTKLGRFTSICFNIRVQNFLNNHKDKRPSYKKKIQTKTVLDKRKDLQNWGSPWILKNRQIYKLLNIVLKMCVNGNNHLFFNFSINFCALWNNKFILISFNIFNCIILMLFLSNKIQNKVWLCWKFCSGIINETRK